MGLLDNYHICYMDDVKSQVPIPDRMWGRGLRESSVMEINTTIAEARTKAEAIRTLCGESIYTRLVRTISYLEQRALQGENGTMKTQAEISLGVLMSVLNQVQAHPNDASRIAELENCIIKEKHGAAVE